MKTSKHTKEVYINIYIYIDFPHWDLVWHGCFSSCLDGLAAVCFTGLSARLRDVARFVSVAATASSARRSSENSKSRPVVQIGLRGVEKDDI